MKVVWSLLISLACICAATTGIAKTDAIDGGMYTTKDKENYLTPEQMLFIRPGLEVIIMDVTIPADRQTEVTFKLTDPAGLPLDRSGVFTPGPVSTSFILAYIPEGGEAYMAYTSRIQTSPITGESAEQGTSDSGGSYTDLGDGMYMYKFGTVLPADYDMDVTHTLGIYARRDLTEFDLDRYVTNELKHWVPSGMSAAKPRSIVTTETCNGRCHDPIALHGGARTEVGLCILCHNPYQDIDPDTGNSVDMPLMIHKIHMGENLENGYNIIGYRQTNHDYSHVIYPAEIIECESCHTGGTPTDAVPLVAEPNPVPVCDMSGLGSTTLNWGDLDGFEIHMGSANGPLFVQGAGEGSADTGNWVADGTVFVLVDTASGETVQELTVNATTNGCVTNAAGTFRGVAATDHSNWMTNPGRKSCGACHDWVNFETGEVHSASNLPQSSDAFCDRCHAATGPEFGASVAGAHTPMYKSAQLPGPTVNFIEVMDTNPGDTPTVVFSLGGKNGMVHPGEMDRLRLTINGPNDDWDFYVMEDIFSDGTLVQMDDNWAYTFSTPLPDDAAGSFTVAVEGRINVDIMVGGETESYREYIHNPTMAFAVTDAAAVPRRMVVSDEKCEACHVNISLHGGNRRDVPYCNTCHMPDLLDIADVPANVSMKWMIHKIHRGAELENGYVVIRSRGTYDFSHIEFTGDLRNCDACHVNDSQQLPLPAGLLPTPTPQQWWSPMQPTTAACLSCHDGDDAAVHAYTNMSFFGESCATCHGEGKAYSVDKVHAR
jgi:hypothetical protein